MKKTPEKTIIYVVDFVSKQPVLKEVLLNKNGKKDEASLARISSAISELVVAIDKGQRKAS